MSFYSYAMLSAPSIPLNSSVGDFLAGFGNALGSVWKSELDPAAWATATRAVMIRYIADAFSGSALFFGPSNMC